MKFGGTSVGTTDTLTQVISIILQENERWDQLIVVASALEGVTDALIEAAHLANMSNRRGYRRIIATIRTRHLALVEKLPLRPEERNALQADIDQLLFDMLDVCQALSDAPAEGVAMADKVDAVIGVGERLAAQIIASMLREKGLRGVAIDATQLIVTDDTFGNAKPDFAATQARVQRDLIPMTTRDIIPVVTGFIGGTEDGRPTTLGRGGSDFTASILGICTASDEVWMWTDVDGMMSADPRSVDETMVIPELSYAEAAEMAYFGARVLHARMVIPLQEHGIPLHIKNVYKPQQAGTLIVDSTAVADRIKAITAIHGIGLSSHRSGSLSAIIALVNTTMAASIGTEADVMMTSQSPQETLVSFVIPTTAGPDAPHTAQRALQSALGEFYEEPEWSVLPVAIVSAIGEGIATQAALAGSALSALNGIPILALSQGASGTSLSIVITPQHADEAVNRLHRLAK